MKPVRALWIQPYSFGETKMTSKTMLRCLIVGEVALDLMGLASDSMLEKTLPQEIQQYIVRAEGADLTPPQILGLAIGLPLVIGLIVGWIGLWRLWRPARLIYTLCWLLGVPIYLFLEPVVYYTPLGAVLSEYSVLAAGMIFGLIYFSDLSVRFMKKQTELTTGANAG